MSPTLNLLFRNGLGNKVRGFLTILVIAIAVVAFGLLQTAVKAYYIGAEASAPDRLVTRHNVSLMFSLPLAYKQQLEKVAGVERVAYGNWFGGYYQDPSNFFAQFAVDDTYLDLYPEFMLTDDERRNFLKERKACVIGEKLARRFGWKVGDTFILQGGIFPGDWEFVVRGVYRGRDRTTDTTAMYFRWDYLNEYTKANLNTQDRVGWYTMQIADPGASARLSKDIDTLYTNSTAQTRTETEKAFQMSFVSMAGAIIAAINAISFVVVVIVLLVMANTMMMAARERLSQFGVMKTFGFQLRHFTIVIAGEAMFIAFVGAVAGILVSYPMVAFFGAFLEMNLGSFFPVFELSTQTVIQAAGLCLACGLISSIFPIINAMRTPIASALRKAN
jgi:putative ABC transport system permease protein